MQRLHCEDLGSMCLIAHKLYIKFEVNRVNKVGLGRRKLGKLGSND